MTTSLYGLAPCVFYEPPLGGIQAYAASIGAYRGLGIYSINGPNWAAELVTICDQLDTVACN